MRNHVVHWEIGGHDLDTLTSFYSQLFDWNVEPFSDDYRVVAPDDGIGGGLMRCRDDIPQYVTFYVSVDDLETTLDRVEDLGGLMIVPPSPIPDVGSFALFQDPEGNTIGLLQSIE